jgi:hypothetical protein
MRVCAFEGLFVNNHRRKSATWRGGLAGILTIKGNEQLIGTNRTGYLSQKSLGS